MLGINSINIKYSDSIYYLIENELPSETIIIGPSYNCGHCAIINGANITDANCASILV